MSRQQQQNPRSSRLNDAARQQQNQQDTNQQQQFYYPEQDDASQPQLNVQIPEDQSGYLKNPLYYTRGNQGQTQHLGSTMDNSARYRSHDQRLDQYNPQSPRVDDALARNPLFGDGTSRHNTLVGQQIQLRQAPVTPDGTSLSGQGFGDQSGRPGSSRFAPEQSTGGTWQRNNTADYRDTQNFATHTKTSSGEVTDDSLDFRTPEEKARGIAPFQPDSATARKMLDSPKSPLSQQQYFNDPQSQYQQGQQALLAQGGGANPPYYPSGDLSELESPVEQYYEYEGGQGVIIEHKNQKPLPASAFLHEKARTGSEASNTQRYAGIWGQNGGGSASGMSGRMSTKEISPVPVSSYDYGAMTQEYGSGYLTQTMDSPRQRSTFGVQGEATGPVKRTSHQRQFMNSAPGINDGADTYGSYYSQSGASQTGGSTESGPNSLYDNAHISNQYDNSRGRTASSYDQSGGLSSRTADGERAKLVNNKLGVAVVPLTKTQREAENEQRIVRIVRRTFGCTCCCVILLLIFFSFAIFCYISLIWRIEPMHTAYLRSIRPLVPYDHPKVIADRETPVEEAFKSRFVKITDKWKKQPVSLCYYHPVANQWDKPWRMPPKLLNPSWCTHIVYGGIQVDSRGPVITKKDELLIDKINDIRKEKAKHLKLILSYGSVIFPNDIDTQGKQPYKPYAFNETVKTVVARSLVAQSMVDEARRLQADGIDINLARITSGSAGNQADVQQFFQSVATVARSQQSIVGVEEFENLTGRGDQITLLRAPPPPPAAEDLTFTVTLGIDEPQFDTVVDIQKLLQIIDWINWIPTSIDFRDRRQDLAYLSRVDFRSGSNPKGKKLKQMSMQEQLDWLYGKTIKPKHLVFAFPLYARVFQLPKTQAVGGEQDSYDVGDPVDGVTTIGESVPFPGYTNFQELQEILAESEVACKYDALARTCYSQVNDTWVTYDNTDGVTSKAALLKGFGARGIFFLSPDLAEKDGRLESKVKIDDGGGTDDERKEKKGNKRLALENFQDNQNLLQIYGQQQYDFDSEQRFLYNAGASDSQDFRFTTRGLQQNDQLGDLLYKGRMEVVFEIFFREFNNARKKIYKGGHAPPPPPTIRPPPPPAGPPPPPTPTPPPPPEWGAQRLVNCWYDNQAQWRTFEYKFTADDVDATSCSHITYSHAIVNEDGEAELKEFNDEKQIAKLRNIRKDSFQGHVQILLSIGSEAMFVDVNSRFLMSQIADSATGRQKFIKSALEILQQNKLDGFDIAWYYPGHPTRGGRPSDKRGLVLLLKDFRTAMDLLSKQTRRSPSRPYLLTLTASVDPQIMQDGYDVPKITKLVDWVNLQTYSFSSIYEQTTQLNAPLLDRFASDSRNMSVASGIESWIGAGSPSRKLMLGVPFYGQAYKLKNEKFFSIGSQAEGPAEPGPYTASAGILAYYEVVNLLRNRKAIEYFEPYAQVPIAIHEETWVSYETPQSVKQKANVAILYNLRGVHATSLDYDDFRAERDTYPLLSNLAFQIQKQEPSEVPGFDGVPEEKAEFYSSSQIDSVDGQSATGPSEGDGGFRLTPLPKTESMDKLVLPEDKVVVCYYATWAVYRTKRALLSIDIDPRLCSHVIFAFANVKKDFTISLYDERDEQSLDELKAVRAEFPHLKILLAIGGWNFNTDKDTRSIFTELVGGTVRRAKFIDEAIKTCRVLGVDGIDFDWEFPGVPERGGKPNDKQNLATLFEEMRSEIQNEFKNNEDDQDRLLMTVAIPNNATFINAGYDLERVHKVVDWVGIMSYDYEGAWNLKTGHNAPLFSRPELPELSVDWTVQYLLGEGVPSNKLVMGIPLYGRTWTLRIPDKNGVGADAVSGGEEGPYTKAEGFLSYFELLDAGRGVNKDAQRRELLWDEVSQVPYMVIGDQWISYDDDTSIRLKVNYGKVQDLKGYMTWSIDMDEFQFGFPLQFSIVDELNKAETQPIIRDG